MMRPFTTLIRVVGLGLCAVVFAGSALADPGNGTGNGNGNGGTPPGQEKKAEQPAPAPAPAAAPAPVPAQQVAAPGQAKKTEKSTAKTAEKSEHKSAAKSAHKTRQSAKVERKSEQKSEAKTHRKSAEKSARKSEPKASTSKGRSAEAHHHVIICHRTGSDSNPYVVINIPWTAWSEAHSPDTGAHPDLNGRHDIMLKDPASRPGSKDGFSKSDCAAAAPAPVQPIQQPQPTDICPNIEGMQTSVPAGIVKDASGNCVPPPQQQQVDVCPNIEGMQVSVPAGHVKDASGNCLAPPAPASAIVASTPAVATPAAAQSNEAPKGEVLAAVTPAKEAAAKDKPASGVLGAVASAPASIGETASSGNLPFTGIPLWIAALLGGGLLTTGLLLRRAGQH